jgi:hypothetical protein
MAMVEFRSLFQKLRERRSMQGVPAGLTGAIVFMLACDAATGQQLLAGFAQWINLRRGGDGETSLAWFGEIVASVLGGDVAGKVPYWNLDPRDAARVERELFLAVDEFLAESR